MTWLSPPRIVHQHVRNSDDRPALCKQCGAALKMSKGEVRLLLFYATCQTGFTPSLQLLSDQTGLSRKGVQKCRKALVSHGVIALSRYCVYVDWARIRLFASLDPAFISRHATIEPVPIPGVDTLDPVYLEAIPLEDALRVFGSMPEEDYLRWRQSYRQHFSRQRTRFEEENSAHDWVDEIETVWANAPPT